MSESWKTRVARWRFGWFPAFRNSGARVRYIAHDWREVRVDLRLNRKSRNYVGTLFGGSLYTTTDPFYMIMLMQNLGPDYIVWDKGARIQFLKPGRGTLHAHFRLDQAELDGVREALRNERSLERTYVVELVDGAGVPHARVEKLIYIRKRRDGERPQGGGFQRE